ncbi:MULTISPECIES: branched-chain amino acid transporter permease [Acetobacterium]|jgi:branched-subunit amino acid transport protein AzlD|uniref:branched-chain amino acid transporter permease n=1 Tax=Acetobacterium TaxID=33951 RepID=UPI002ACA67BB|nr:branched-chain amino acid transporter permease [Acetobacterium sp. K1/6]MDZ5724286.1 branched-chain amino acid transporter permease [Acetobacterium sp. K1/6]
MSPEITTPLLVVLVVAACTFMTRFLPFALFGGGKEVPALVKTLGDLLPPAVIAILVVYCLKGVSLMVPPHGFPEYLAVGIVALLHVWKRNNLLSIGGGTLVYMVLIQMVFI